MLLKEIIFGSKEVVKYDIVLINVGGVYVLFMGIFIVFYKGIYIIFCSFMSSLSNFVYFNIMKNGNVLVFLYFVFGIYLFVV